MYLKVNKFNKRNNVQSFGKPKNEVMNRTAELTSILLFKKIN